MNRLRSIPMRHLQHQNLRAPALPPHPRALLQPGLEHRSLSRNRRHHSLLRRSHTRVLLDLRSSVGVLDVLLHVMGRSVALR